MISFSGKVIKGAQRGKDLGFPTANVALKKKIEEGIYLAKSEIANRKSQNYPSLVFIGSAKTFNEKDYKAEIYLLDFSGNLYGKTLEVSLLKKIRDNKKFATIDELKKQMNEDLIVARKFFAPWC